MCNSTPVGKGTTRYFVLHIFSHSVAHTFLVKFKNDCQLFEQFCKLTLQFKVSQFDCYIVHHENFHIFMDTFTLILDCIVGLFEETKNPPGRKKYFLS